MCLAYFLTCYLYSKALADDSGRLVQELNACTVCELASYKSATHMVMQCPYQPSIRMEMYSAMANIGRGLDKTSYWVEQSADGMTKICFHMENLVDIRRYNILQCA